MAKRKSRLWLFIVIILIVAGLVIGGQLYSSWAPEYINATLSDDASGDELMWHIHYDSIGLDGDVVMLRVNSGNTDTTGTKEYVTQDTLQITITVGETVSRFPAHPRFDTYAVVDYDYDAIAEKLVWNTDNWEHYFYEDLDAYEYDSGSKSLTYTIEIKAGGEVAFSETVTYSYDTMYGLHSYETAWGTIYIDNRHPSGDFSILDVSDALYFNVEDRDGNEHNFLTRENAVNSLITQWLIFVDDETEGILPLIPLNIPFSKLGDDWWMSEFRNNPEYQEYVPFVDDWEAGVDRSSFWTVLEWGDIKNRLGPNNYASDVNDYMFEADDFYINENGGNMDTYMDVVYLANQVSPSFDLYLPIEMADTLVHDFTPCNAVPSISNAYLSGERVAEQQHIKLYFDVTNNDAESCPIGVFVDSGIASSQRVTSLDTWDGYETRTMEYDIVAPVFEGDIGGEIEFDICMYAKSGILESEHVCLELTVYESTLTPSVSPTDWTPTITTAPGTTGDDDEASYMWLVIVIVILCIGVGGAAMMLKPKKKRR